MQIKKLIKITVASLLVLSMAVVLFACKQNKTQIDEEGKLPNQEENLRYYFQQGYRTNWGIIRGDAEKWIVDRETGLILMLAPLVSEPDEKGSPIPVKTIGGDGTESFTAIEGVEYAVYFHNGEGITMTTSRNDVVGWLQDPDSPFYFNNKHYIGAPRETFLQKGESTIFTAKYSKLQFTTVSYTFTRDGEDWQGVYNIVMNGTEYFIVTFEAKSSLYNEYYEEYSETIGDFRKRGWETSDVG
ncbi:MAG: hypothetical protein ILO53_07890 [Clostridia bacterium]|nr:hypothetical protein [Clostridia bacterium]